MRVVVRARKDAQDDVAADRFVGDGLLAGGVYRVQSVATDDGEGADELTIAAQASRQRRPDLAHRFRQVPLFERSSVSQRPRLPLQDGQLVPRIVDGFVAAKMAQMDADHHVVPYHDDPVSICPHRDRLADGHGVDAVPVAVEVHE